MRIIHFIMHNPKDNKLYYLNKSESLTVWFSQNSEILWYFMYEKKQNHVSVYELPIVLKEEMISIANEFIQTEIFKNWAAKNIHPGTTTKSSISITDVHHLEFATPLDILPQPLMTLFDKITDIEPDIFLVELTVDSPNTIPVKINAVTFRLEQIVLPNDYLFGENNDSLLHHTHSIHISSDAPEINNALIYPLAFVFLPILKTQLPNVWSTFNTEDIPDDFLP